MKSRGFTLIELLVVIAIIGLLSSVVFASLNSARAKARDAKRISDMKQVQTALVFYFDKYGRYPNETLVGGPPNDPYYVLNFTSMAKELVDEGFLSGVPVPPAGFDAYYNYHYYNYITSYDPSAMTEQAGAQLVTQLEAAPPSTGYPGSCRPWIAGINWCDARSNTYFCLCSKY